MKIAEGRDYFADHCAICHANDRSGKTIPPDLRSEDTQQLSDGELM